MSSKQVTAGRKGSAGSIGSAAVMKSSKSVGGKALHKSSSMPMQDEAVVVGDWDQSKRRLSTGDTHVDKQEVVAHESVGLNDHLPLFGGGEYAQMLSALGKCDPKARYCLTDPCFKGPFFTVNKMRTLAQAQQIKGNAWDLSSKDFTPFTLYTVHTVHSLYTVHCTHHTPYTIHPYTIHHTP
jgi:hypothetical protein